MSERSKRTSRHSSEALATPRSGGVSSVGELVTLHVWRTSRGALPRALTRMAVDPGRLRALPGVRFGKLLGTGTGTGFGPGDADLTRWAALTVWDSPAAAAGFDDSPVGRAWARIARAHARVDLRPLSSRGEWSGQRPFGEPSGGRVTGPVLALTRARLRARRAATFWRAIPRWPPPCATLPGCWPGSASARRHWVGRAR